MPRRTNDFQRLVAVIQGHLDPDAIVEEPAMIEDRSTGTLREVDVCVRGYVAKQPVVVSIECRDRGRAADVTWVDEMHGKHLRLPTNLLVLVSHSPFTPEAVRAADAHGIKHVFLEDMDAAAPDRLFPELESLWGKTWSLTIERVSITVEATDSLPRETVRAHPDTSLFLEDGTPLGSAAEMANALARLEPLQAQLGSEALPEHKFAQFGWEHLAFQGKRVYLKKLEPLILRPIERFNVIAKCSVTVNEFPLRHGRYRDVCVAWGKGTMLGCEMMLVATEDGEGTNKLSVRIISDGG